MRRFRHAAANARSGFASVVWTAPCMVLAGLLGIAGLAGCGGGGSSAPQTKTYTLGGGGVGIWIVDDNLDAYVNGTLVYTTHDGPAVPHDQFSFAAKQGDTVRLVVRDTGGVCWSLSALYLSDQDGHSKLVEPGSDFVCGEPSGDQGVKLDHSFQIPF